MEVKPKASLRPTALLSTPGAITKEPSPFALRRAKEVAGDVGLCLYVHAVEKARAQEPCTRELLVDESPFARQIATDAVQDLLEVGLLFHTLEPPGDAV